ncbi:hypothetical protein LMH87_006140 [Akanthomyces muscarius]|uniref:Uncharacterized protein n=1 Tax=Akanthomyces muscarius TaxID=2231603 RepID=A0A9W8QPQ8_AKAMU|nr:hypothetical protein LMH87_006140 [Akanthomyces muscarius]KAJ4164466.1 hypothetical protein LMH87_006140 [Akanthomyces muscarius]
MAARLLRGCLCEDMDVILGPGIRPVDSKIAEAPRSVALAIVVSDVDRRKARDTFGPISIDFCRLLKLRS